jgi:hypothetical protein
MPIYMRVPRWLCCPSVLINGRLAPEVELGDSSQAHVSYSSRRFPLGEFEMHVHVG